MPRCLLTNPVVNHNLLAKELVRRGVECFAYIEMDNVQKMATTKHGDKRHDFDHTLFADIYLKMDDLPDPKESPFEAVIAGGELGVESADLLGRHYGLRGNDPATTKWRRNKEAMQQRLREVGLPSIKSVGITQGDGVDRILESIPQGPYILKPVEAAGGEGLHFCQSPSQLVDVIGAIKWGAFNCTWKHNDRYLVQEYVPGIEYAVDLVACDGLVVVSAICRYIRLSDIGDWGHPNVKRFLVVEDPTNPKYAHLIDAAIKNCHALGIAQGAAHMEFLDGPKGLYMVEVGARLHGALAPQLFSACFENDLLTSLYQSYFDDVSRLLPGRLVRFGAQSLIVAERDGLYEHFDAAEEIWMANCDSLVVKSLTYEPGDRFKETVDEVLIPAYGFLANADFGALLHDTWKFDQIQNRHFNGRPYELAELASWFGEPFRHNLQ